MGKKSSKAKELSGHFVLRLAPETHKALKQASARAQVSLNELCKKILEENIHGVSKLSGFAPLVKHCHEFFGNELVGIAVYGSWTRGMATKESDIDVIAVLHSDMVIDRQLYTKWDAASLHLDSRFQVNFAHLPGNKALSSLWCEIAIDGIMLFEKDFSLSRHLIMVRHEILAGRVRRQVSHGQPYWIFEDDVS